MLEIQKKRKCTGCGACANICPVFAITMSADSEGFSYPIIDNNKCIDCKKCRQVCPTFTKNQKGLIPLSKKIAYLCYLKDEQMRVASSSGGVFYALAMTCIRNGGVVFGVRFNEEWRAIHASATDESGVKAFQISKYVQSDVGDTYTEAKICLEEGKAVLFSGTPCQIVGLKKFLGKDYPNLTTCDFICHGVPSPEVWQSYVEYREEKAGEKVRSVQFRDKKEGWLQSFFFSFIFKNEETYRQYKTQDIYYQGFLNDLFVRPCCHRCSFRKFNRMADITIADAWGIKKYAPKFYNSMGVSFIIIHTEIGTASYKSIQDAMSSCDIAVTTPLMYNTNFYYSGMPSLYRKKFFMDWKTKGIECAVENNLKSYDKLFRRCVQLLRGMPIYIKRFGAKKS